MKPKIAFATTATAFVMAVISSICVEMSEANAKPKQKHNHRDSVYFYGPDGPNASYQAGPHTRIYVTKRSWLDAGTEVLPGDRKFNDYAFPPGYSFAHENANRPLHRQPLNPASDMGGYPQGIPLY